MDTPADPYSIQEQAWLVRNLLPLSGLDYFEAIVARVRVLETELAEARGEPAPVASDAKPLDAESHREVAASEVWTAIAGLLLVCDAVVERDKPEPSLVRQAAGDLLSAWAQASHADRDQVKALLAERIRDERRHEAARRLASMQIEDVPDPDELNRQLDERRDRYPDLD